MLTYWNTFKNSSIYIFSKQSFKLADKKRIGLNPYMYEIDKIEAIDIDEPDDFLFCDSTTI